MKKLRTLIATSILMAVPVGLPAQSTNQTTIQDVKQAGKNAVTTAGNYSAQQIKELDKAAEKQFRELGRKLDDLKAKAKTQTGQARADMDKKIAEAQKKLDDLKPKLQELKTAATNAWAQAKSAFDRGIKDFEQAF